MHAGVPDSNVGGGCFTSLSEREFFLVLDTSRGAVVQIVKVWSERH